MECLPIIYEQSVMTNKQLTCHHLNNNSLVQIKDILIILLLQPAAEIR